MKKQEGYVGSYLLLSHKKIFLWTVTTAKIHRTKSWDYLVRVKMDMNANNNTVLTLLIRVNSDKPVLIQKKQRWWSKCFKNTLCMLR